MTNRITRMAVTLPKAYVLRGAGKPIPAGRYEVTMEEEPLGDLMEPAYRRVAASLYVPLPDGRIGIGQILDIDQPDFAALLKFKS